MIKLQEKGAQIVTTYLEADKFHYEVDYNNKTVIVMGAEDEGVSDEIVKISDEVVKIPCR